MSQSVAVQPTSPEVDAEDVREAIRLGVETELAMLHGAGELPDLPDLPEG